MLKRFWARVNSIVSNAFNRVKALLESWYNRIFG